jgi:hypothetical protein
MKIYVVTSGDYSDYHIDKVFIDEEKAKKYIECQNRYLEYNDKSRLEEYDTEEKDFESVVEIWVSYEDKPKFKFTKKYMCTIESFTTIDKASEDFEISCRWDDWDKTLKLNMEQVLPININNIDEFKNKYQKICEDLMTQIKSLYEIESWTIDMINDWLKEKYKGYVFHN